VSAGYSYTTITSGREEATRIGVSFHLDGISWVRACGLDTDRPQLDIDHGQVTARFSPVPDVISETDVRVARQLADQAALYAAAVERVHAQQAAQDATGTAA
jgi:hypothetical protein